jgi:hypothetical protein
MTANAQRERESNDAAESRRRLGRMKRSTNGGAYAVCADEHVASGRLAICEQQRAATAIHGETCRLTGPCDHIESLSDTSACRFAQTSGLAMAAS